MRRSVVGLMAVATLAGGFAVGYAIYPTVFAHQDRIDQTFQPKDLPSLTGRLKDGGRIVESGIDKPNLVNYGPYLALPKGRYVLTIRYRSTADAKQTVGSWDVAKQQSSQHAGVWVTGGSLLGSAGAETTVKAQLDVSDEKPNLFQFRTNWNGVASLTLLDIRISQQ